MFQKGRASGLVLVCANLGDPPPLRFLWVGAHVEPGARTTLIGLNSCAHRCQWCQGWRKNYPVSIIGGVPPRSLRCNLLPPACESERYLLRCVALAQLVVLLAGVTNIFLAFKDLTLD